jgi:hypothetical protein
MHLRLQYVCSLRYVFFLWETLVLHLHPEDGGSTLPRNVGTYKVSHRNLTIFKIKYRNSSVFRDSFCIYKTTRRDTSEDLGHQSSGFSASEQITALCGTHNLGSHSSSRPYVIFFNLVYSFLRSGIAVSFLANHQDVVTFPVYWPPLLIDFIHSYSIISGGRSLSTTWGHPYYSERDPLNMDTIKTVYITNFLQ